MVIVIVPIKAGRRAQHEPAARGSGFEASKTGYIELVERRGNS